MADWGGGDRGTYTLPTLPGWAALGEQMPIQHCPDGRAGGADAHTTLTSAMTYRLVFMQIVSLPVALVKIRWT